MAPVIQAASGLKVTTQSYQQIVSGLRSRRIGKSVFSTHATVERHMKFVVASLLVFSICANAQGVFGRRAPGFSLPDLKYQQHDIQDYRGKVVLLDIMKTDCPHCQDLTRTLEQVKAKYGDKIQIFSIVNPPDSAPSVSRYISEFKITYPVLLDCGQVVASYLQITPQKPSLVVPHLIVIDKAGMIQRDMTEGTQGGLSLQAIASTIDPLLK